MSVDSFAGPDSLSVESAERIDRICDRFEAAWRDGEKPRIDEHLADSTEPERSVLWRELVTIEVEYRRRSNDEPTITEYESQFPEHRRFLQVLISDHAPADPHRPGSKTPMASGLSVNHQLASATNHDDFTAAFDSAIGSTLGDYELLAKVGTGGMGLVYRARQRRADRIVAVKVIRPRVADELSPARYKEWLERFEREAKLTAALEHDDIVPIYEVGDADGQPFYAMRYIDGQSLGDLIRQGPIPSCRAAMYMERVARAVHFAHLRGVLHRDLKPGNILIDRDDRPYVSDFGLAKWVEGVSSLTETGVCLGSPPYMSPEQVQDAASVSAASDVYSLGATLYDALTGRPPFKAARVAETLNQVIHRDPVPPRQLNPDIDRDLETITLKCLRKDPDTRYQTAEELAEDLQRYLEHKPVHAQPVGWMEKTWRWMRRNPVAATLAASVSALLLSLLVLMSVGYWTVSKAWKETADERDHARNVTRAALLDEARALRLSTEGGRRWKALDALRRAAEIRPDVDIRDEYIRCLDTADIRLLIHLASEPNARAALEVNLDGVDRLFAFPTGPRVEADSTREITFEELSREHEVLWSRPNARHYVIRSRTDKHVAIWDRTSNRVRYELKDHRGERIEPELLTFSAQSDLVAFAYTSNEVNSSTDAKIVRVLRLTDAAAVLLGAWDIGGPGVDCLRFNPAGTILAAGSNLTGNREREYGVRLWDVNRAKELAPLSLEASTGWNADLRAPSRIAFSDDGRYLAAVRGTVRLWSIGDNSVKELWSQSLQSHPADVVHVLPTGRWLATIDRIGQLKLWDALGTGELVTCTVPDSQAAEDAPALGTVPLSSQLISYMTAGPIAGIGIWQWAQPISQTFVPPHPISANAARPDHFALAFSPDERWLAYAAGSSDPDAPYRIDLNKLDAPPVPMHEGGSAPRLLTFSPNSDKLWSAGRRQHTTWPMPSGDPGHETSTGLTIASAFAGDDRVVARLKEMAQLATFDLHTGKEIWSAPPFPTSAVRVSRPQFSRDGSMLLAGFRDLSRTPPVSIVVSKTRTGEAMHEWEGGTGHYFFRDNEPYGLMDTRALTLKNLRTGERLESQAPDRDSPAANYDRFAKFAFSDDGRVCAEFGLTGDIAIWDIGGAERRLRCVISRHRPDSFADQDLRAFNSDGSRIAAFDGRDFLKVWDTQTGQEIGKLKLVSRPEIFAFAPDGEKLLLIYLGQEVRTWSPGEKEYRVTTRLASNPDLDQDRSKGWWKSDYLLIDDAIQWCADRSRLVYVSRSDAPEHHTVFSWRVSDGSLVTHRIPWQGAGSPRVAVNADGTQLAIVGSWGVVEFRNLDSGVSYTSFRWPEWTPENRLESLSKLYPKVRISPDGSHAAWCDTQSQATAIRVFELANAKEIFAFTAGRPVTCLALARGACALAASFGNDVHIYDPRREMQKVVMLHDFPLPVDSLALSDHGDLMATASSQGRTVTLWHARSAEKLASFDTGWSGVSRIALSSSGRWLTAMNYQGRVRLWDILELRSLLNVDGLGWVQ